MNPLWSLALLRRFATIVSSAWHVVILALLLTLVAASPTLAQQNWHPWDSTQALVPPVESTPWDSTGSGWTGRAVVGEYDTGIYCGFCQPHDVAFNALSHRYPATAFIGLAYHYFANFPLGDPADSALDHLHQWYGTNRTPGIFDHSRTKGDDDWIDGESFSANALMAGAGASYDSAKYATLARAVDAELRRPPEAFFQVQTRVTNGQVQVRVRVDSVVGQHPKTYLRLVLVEDTVSLLHPLYWYWARARQLGAQELPLRREHHMVVRAVAHEHGLPMGLALQGSGTVEYIFDVAAIQRRHLSYQADGLSTIIPEYLADTANAAFVRQIVQTFPDAHDWRMDPRRLHVVAFVQDAHTGEVLQAIMVPIAGNKLQLP